MKTYCQHLFLRVKTAAYNIRLLPVLFIFLIAVPVMALMTTSYWHYSILIAPMLIAGIFLFRSKSLGVYLLIAQIPFGAYRKISVGSSSINLAWIIAGISVLAVAVEIFINAKSFAILKAKLWWFLIPMFLVNALATIFSPYPQTAVPELVEWIVAYIFIALILVRITSEGLFHTVPLWIVLSVSLGSFCAVLGVYLKIGAEYFTLEGRGIGGAPDPNNMCLMVVFAIPIVLHLFLYAENAKKRMVYLGLLLINLLAVVSTNSRSGIMAAALVILILMAANRGKITAKLIKLIIPAGLSMVIVLPFMLPDSLVDRMMTLTAAHSDTSLNRRASYVTVALEAYMQSPVIGTGPFTFQNIYEKSREARRWQRGTDATLALQRQAHNTYLEVLVGSGTIGIILFLALLIATYRNFSTARGLLRAKGLYRQADLMTSYQLSFISLLIFLAFFSDPTHKYLLLITALAELAVKYAKQMQRNVQTPPLDAVDVRAI